MVISDIQAGDDGRDAAEAENSLDFDEPVYRRLFRRRNTRRLRERNRRHVFNASLLRQWGSIPH